ncbi:MAG: isochorismate synthase, partial [Lautropia sp.]|nr:isochorismate synthase [Lautropia sp.]
RELVCTDIHRRIDTPASDGFNPHGRFRRALDAAFDEARQAGIDDPLIVGAIPFDSTQPSSLFVPVTHHWQAKTPSNSVRPLTEGSLQYSDAVPDERGFKHSVKHAVVNFEYSDVRKAVLSISRQLQFSSPIDLDILQANLRAQNPSGYLFRVSLPDDGTLIGVSPELLVRKHGNRMESNPLAGSIGRRPTEAEDQENARQLMASEKDHFEHKLVVDDIRHHLGPLCSELDIPEKPSLLQTATLWHLSTFLHGTLKDENLSALQLACLLHPTPAVCGVPTERARRLIRFVEAFDRGLFTGVVGWCNSKGEGEWVITIRCGLARHDTIRIFAGAGIVAASNPDTEWTEVQTKLGTMLRACGISS